MARTVSKTKKVVVKSLVDAGMPYREVNEVTGVSLGHISTIVKDFEGNKELVEFFKKNKVDTLLKAQHDNLNLQDVIRKTITEDEVRGMSVDQRQRWFSALGVNFGIIYDKTRLEGDESTDNVKTYMKYVFEVRSKIRGDQKHPELVSEVDNSGNSSVNPIKN
jgi:transposase